MEAVDCLVELNDAWVCTKKRFTSLFTIKIDPFKISKDPIQFNGCRDYGGYSIIGATDETSRRIVHWFYRNVKAPTLNDWLDCLFLFDLQDIPIHILQLYNHDKDPLNKFILIHSVTRDFIHYTFEDRDENKSITVTVPMGVASLVPERFLFNLNLYCNKRKG